MFARHLKLDLETMGGDKESQGDLSLPNLLTKAAQSRPDLRRNHNCTKKLRRNAQLCLRFDYGTFAESLGCWIFEGLESQQRDCAPPLKAPW
jgi:hypothetical protein